MLIPETQVAQFGEVGEFPVPVIGGNAGFLTQARIAACGDLVQFGTLFLDSRNFRKKAVFRQVTTLRMVV